MDSGGAGRHVRKRLVFLVLFGISLGNTKKTNKTIGFLARKASFFIKTNYFIENTNIFAKQHTKRCVYIGFAISRMRNVTYTMILLLYFRNERRMLVFRLVLLNMDS